MLNIKEENKLINDLETFGFLFEAMVERDLKVYADSFNAKCYHYQDYQDKEIDSVIPDLKALGIKFEDKDVKVHFFTHFW